MNDKEFYSKFGDLLYAVANIDGVITQKEKKVLQDIVRKELLPKETGFDEYNTNIAYYTEMEFDFLEGQIIETETSFISFIDFVEKHYADFDDKRKKVCLYVAKKLADSYYYTNKKEKKLIEILEKKLKNIHTKKLSIA